MKKSKSMYTGIGLVLGCGWGFVLSILVGQTFYVGVGVAIGLLVGAYFDMKNPNSTSGGDQPRDDEGQGDARSRHSRSA